MTRYFFHIQAGQQLLVDSDGILLQGLDAAMRHARIVACEMQKGGELPRRHWRVRVCLRGGAPCGELLFAAVDRTLDHLPPKLRNSIEQACCAYADLQQTVAELDNAVSQSRARLARACGPYLVAERGRLVGAPSARHREVG